MLDNKFTFSSFIEITKLRLSVSVVFSSVISYLIGMSEFNFEIFLFNRSYNSRMLITFENRNKLANSFKFKQKEKDEAVNYIG